MVYIYGQLASKARGDLETIVVKCIMIPSCSTWYSENLNYIAGKYRDCSYEPAYGGLNTQEN